MIQLSKQQKIGLGISRLLSLAGFFIIFFVVFSFIATLILSLIYQISIAEISRNLISPTPDSQSRVMYFIFQGITATGAFIFTAWFFLGVMERKKISTLNSNPIIKWNVLPLTFLITLSMMPFTAFIIELNENLQFPAFMASFESWAMEKEQLLKELTVFLTNFSNNTELILGLLVIAVIPAIGEELFFRGMLQRNLSYWLNIHLAIWLTGFIFSAIHFQFYGFFPRMLLGVLFGYLYFWSGNIWVAVFAHFINNAFTLLMIHLYNTKVIQFNIESAESIPLIYVYISLLLTLVLLYYFKRIYDSNSVNTASLPE